MTQHTFLPPAPGLLPEMKYLLWLPQVGRYLWGIDGAGRLRTTEHREKAWRLYESEAKKQAREVLLETGCTVEFRPARERGAVQ